MTGSGEPPAAGRAAPAVALRGRSDVSHADEPGTPSARPPSREPRQDRSRATRQRLLEAAVECLAELGWAGTTMTVVAERAGTSRGSAQYHFGTREELVTDAIGYLSEVREAEMRAAAAALPGGRPQTGAVLEILSRSYTGQLFRAALHLWVAAAADGALRDRLLPVEARVGRGTHRLAVDLLGVDERQPGARETVQATLDLLRGLGLAALLTDDRDRRERLLGQWAWMLDSTLAPPRASRTL